MNLHIQLVTISVMFGSGMLLGIFLDTYHVIKERMRLKGWVISLIDLVYWLGSACLVFTLLLWSNWGELRFYIFVAICIGFLIYFRLLRQYVLRWIQMLIQAIEWLILTFLHIFQHFLWVPITKFSQLLFRFISLVTIVPLRWMFQPLVNLAQKGWGKVISKQKKEK